MTRGTPRQIELSRRARERTLGRNGWTPEMEAKRRAEHPEWYPDDDRFDGWVPLSQRYPEHFGLLEDGELPGGGA